jgi:hypothetical protein
VNAVRFDGGPRDGPGMGGSENEAFLMRLQVVVREMEARSLVGSLVVSDGFADRVMAAIATEPLPRGTFLAGATGVLRGALAPFAAIFEAWRVSMTRGRPLLVRLQAFALILAVAFALGSAGALAAIGAGRWLAAERHDGPAVIPGPTPPTTEGVLPPAASPTPTPSSEPLATDAPTPSAAASATGRPGTTTGAAPAPRAPVPHVRPAPAPIERADGSEDESSGESDKHDAPDLHSGDGSSTSPDGPGSDPDSSDSAGSDAGG